MSLRKNRVAILRMAVIPVVLLAAFVSPPWSVGSAVSFSLQSVGYVMLVAGLAIRIWSVIYIGGRKSRQLVCDGPYSLCRNPLYMGTFVIAIGASLCLENLLMLAAVLTIFLPVHVAAARLEESHLLELFPQQYPSYLHQVPRFWPRLRAYHSDDVLTVPLRSIRRVAFDTFAFLMLPLAKDFLDLLHRQGTLPVLLHFP
jgi:protein-S-isoprenylcysteine O-methyltransferase Ste14